MPTRYDWSKAGEPQAEVKDGRLVRSPSKRWWLRVILTIMIIAIAAATAYQVLQNKVDVVNQTARDEVLASHQVITEAATKADSDLIVGFLSGRDPAWATNIREKTSQGKLFEVPALGLPDISRPPISTVENISVSPNLDTARVETRLVYPISLDSTDNSELALIRTFVYRRGADRWLLSPPDKEDWGEQETMASTMITISYPAQDELLVKRLIARLEHTLTTICKRENGLSCPADYHVEVRLEPDQARIDDPNREEATGVSSDEITLPSFFLVGLPIDDAGYDLLLRGYQSSIVSAIVADLVNWNCCENLLFFEAFVDHLLAELTIQPWPLEAADYEKPLARMTNLLDQDRSWQITDKNDSNDNQSDIVHAIVEFILNDKSYDQTFDIMRTMVEEDNYQSWLSQVVDSRNSEIDLQGAWMKSLNGKSLSGQIVASSSTPEQDFYLICQSTNPSTPKMYSYSFEADEFTLEDESDYFSYLTAFPDDDAIIYERVRGQEKQTIVRHGETLDVVYRTDRGDGNGLQYTGILNDHEKQLLMYVADAGRPALGRVRPVQYFSLGFEDCQWPECKLRPLQGFTIWSPDFSNSIVQYPQEQPGPYFELMRGDADGNPLAFLGPGRRSFWLDETTYGYINNNEEIILADGRDDRVITILTHLDLVDAIGSESIRSLSIGNIEAERSGSGNLAINTRTEMDDGSAISLFTYNGFTGELSHIARFDDVNVGSPRISPGGKWLTVRTYEALGRDGSEPWSLYVYDLAQGKEKYIFRDSERLLGFEAHPAYDWSADGRWLVRTYRGYLMLTDTFVQVADGSASNRIIIPPLPICDSVAWMNQE